MSSDKDWPISGRARAASRIYRGRFRTRLKGRCESHMRIARYIATRGGRREAMRMLARGRW